MVKQNMIEGRMEMIACVVDPFSQRAHGILQQAGDIIAVDAIFFFIFFNYKISDLD